MSSGAFSNPNYESNSGGIHPIRIQPETASLTVDGVANSAPTGVRTSKIRASVSASPRSNALVARQVTITFGTTQGSYPDGYKPGGTTTVPWLVKSTFDAIIVPTDCQYLGIAARLTGKRGERPE